MAFIRESETTEIAKEDESGILPIHATHVFRKFCSQYLIEMKTVPPSDGYHLVPFEFDNPVIPVTKFKLTL